MITIGPMKPAAFLLLLLIPCSLLAGDLPSLQAKIGEPVLQELMGGCSLKCAFPWEVDIVPAATPNDKTGHPVYATNDDDATSAWVDDGATSIGTKIIFHFPKKLPKELEQTPFYGFDIANGYTKSETIWKSYARIKKARLYYNNKPLYIVDFPDTRRWQQVSFDDIMVRHGESMTLEILEVYPGTKSQDVAITEIVLQGAH
ncbi:MAG: hypothetical protein WCD79_02015 [Chthoniobacteraceae bacterium]